MSKHTRFLRSGHVFIIMVRYNYFIAQFFAGPTLLGQSFIALADY